MVRRRRSDGAAGGRPFERDTLEFSIVLVLAVVTSPVSWSHYYAADAAAVGALSRRPAGPARRRGDALADGRRHACSRRCRSIVLPLGPGIVGAIASRTIVSAWLFGGLLMLAALVRGALHADAAVRRGEAPGGRAMSEAYRREHTPSPDGVPVVGVADAQPGDLPAAERAGAQRPDLAGVAGRLQGDRAAAQLSTCCAVNGSDNSWGAMAIALELFRSRASRCRSTARSSSTGTSSSSIRRRRCSR